MGSPLSLRHPSSEPPLFTSLTGDLPFSFLVCLGCRSLFLSPPHNLLCFLPASGQSPSPPSYPFTGNYGVSKKSLFWRVLYLWNAGRLKGFLLPLPANAGGNESSPPSPPFIYRRLLPPPWSLNRGVSLLCSLHLKH